MTLHNQQLLAERLRAVIAWVGADAIALQQGEEQVSYGQLLQRVTELSHWLQKQPVQVVAILSDNCPEWVVVDLACQMAGKVCLPVPGFFSAQQRGHCLSAADLLVCDSRMPDDVAAICAVTVDSPLSSLTVWRLALVSSADTDMPQGTGKVTFTSGSTGQPKGVCLSSAQQWQVAQSLAQVIGLQRPRHLCLLPLATLLENIAGIYVPLLCGGTVLLPTLAERGMSGSSGLQLPQLLQCLQQLQPTSLILLPQLLAALVSAVLQGWQLPASLRFLAVGGGKVAAELLLQARSLGMPVYEGYGLSECASVVALNTPAADRPGSVGQSLPHCEVQVRDGEVIVSGSVFLGYWGEPASWYPRQVATGDLGERDGAGWLTIDGRRKNLIISSFGRNISPEWVESACQARPLLSQCVVAGEARPWLVALLSAPESVTDQQIDQWLQQVNRELPDYARVQRWLRLPQSAWAGYLTANGRPRREQLLADYEQQLCALYGADHNLSSLRAPAPRAINH
ncbi:AMP-binding protein [Pseudomaricurvus sp. HS19]|uniref:AMP-binding protein n=1 Tax=Pseudomaricurvus sp. HS19 TaxID=2692626 RepID=UPI00136C3EDF|nr:AMP-binding protein [Pseudomaricurvus sp. HS19]MYM64915.1 AMP-binding protein [Pseudomaricurvus sp. HS19]